MKFNQVYHADCLNKMKEFPKSSVDLIFADPPFNIGKPYDSYRDQQNYETYSQWCSQWITECFRLLKPSASIYIAIGDEFAGEINILLKKQGLFFRNWIVWYYQFGQNQRRKFNRSHTHILYFTKDRENFTFNLDSIRIPSKETNSLSELSSRNFP